jgi:hypothetical protein
MTFLGTGDGIDGQKSDGMSQRLLGMMTHFVGTAGCAGDCLSPVVWLCSLRLFRPDLMNTSEENSGVDEWHSIVVIDFGPRHLETWHEYAEKLASLTRLLLKVALLAAANPQNF